MWAFFSKGGWLLVLLGLATAWFFREMHNAEERGRIQAQAERIRHEADSLLSQVRDSLIAEASADSARADSAAAVTEGLKLELASLRGVVRRERGRADSILASLPDTQAAPIIAVIDTLEQAVEVCSDALGSCEQETVAVRGQLEAMSRRALNAEGLATRQGVLIEELQGAQDRFGLWDAVPWAAAALAILAALAF